MENLTVTVHMSKGYSGKTSTYARGYVARITGMDDQYGFRREFLRGTADSRDPFRKSKCTWNDVYECEPGLYEVSEGGARECRVIYLPLDGSGWQNARVSTDRATKIAGLLDDGMSFNAARLASIRPIHSPGGG